MLSRPGALLVLFIHLLLPPTLKAFTTVLPSTSSTPSSSSSSSSFLSSPQKRHNLLLFHPRSYSTSVLLLQQQTPTTLPFSASPSPLQERRQQQHHPQEGNNKEDDERTPYSFILLAATAILISYADRANLATCILPMSQELHWSLPEQGLVLSSFFAGYALTGLFGGYLSDRFGGSVVLQAGMLLWSIFTILTPFLSHTQYGVGATILARVLLGLGEGVAFPAIHSMVSKYVPVARRSVAVGVITAASYVGAVLAFALTPWLINSSGGWPSVFYVFGGLPIFWFPLWWWWLKKEEETKGKLSMPALLSSSSSSFGGSARAGGGKNENDEEEEVEKRTQQEVASGLTWPEIRYLSTRKEIYAILLGQYTQSWGLYGLLSWLPRYYNQAFNIDVSQLALFTVVPYLLQAIVGIASGYVADRWIAMGGRIRTVRCVLQSAGTLLPAAFLLLATQGGAAQTPTLSSSFFYVTAGAALSSLTLAGVSCSHLDICPKHAGFVFAAGNTLATIGGLVSVPVAGYLLEKTGSFDAVFTLFAAHYAVGALVYWWWIGDEDVLALRKEGEGG